MLAVIGPPGAGKSSLLRAIAGLEDPLSGGALVHGSPAWSLASAGPRPGLVSAASRLHDGWTAEKSARAGFEAAGWPGEHLAGAVSSVFEQLSLAPLATRTPSELTTAERHQVLIARELVSFPSMLLLDDPYSGEGAATRREVAGTIRVAREKLGTTVVYASESPDEITATATQTTVLTVPLDITPLADLLKKRGSAKNGGGSGAGEPPEATSAGGEPAGTAAGAAGGAAADAVAADSTAAPGLPAAPIPKGASGPLGHGGGGVAGEPRWVAAAVFGYTAPGDAHALHLAGPGGPAREALLVLDLTRLPGMQWISSDGALDTGPGQPPRGVAWVATGSVRADTGFRRPFGGPVTVEITPGDGSVQRTRAILVDLAESTPALRLELLSDGSGHRGPRLVLGIWRRRTDAPVLRRLAREAGRERACLPVVVAGSHVAAAEQFPYCYLRTTPLHPSPWRSLIRGRIVAALPGGPQPAYGPAMGNAPDLLGRPDLVLSVEHFQRRAMVALQQAPRGTGGADGDPILAAALWALTTGSPGLAMSLLRAGGRDSG